MRILIDQEQIQQRVIRVAQEIQPLYDGKPFTIVGVLTGSLVFLADLIRHLNIPLRIALIQASSYRGMATRPGELHIQDDLLSDLTDRHVLLIDDILDTGRTLSALVTHLNQLNIASLRTAVLLRKIGRQELEFEPDFIGFAIPDEFVVGYGLDYNDEYRHLPYIGVLEEGDHS